MMKDLRLHAGMPIKPVYGPEDLAGRDVDRDIGRPGEYPYTRGIHKHMYRDRLWTMRQYIGFGTPTETNARFKYLMAHGQDALNVAFDLPTQLCMDADDPLAAGEVGKVGASISTLADMRELFDGIPLDQISTSMTINAPAAALLALYIAVAREQGSGVGGQVSERSDRPLAPGPWPLRGTVQNDILKEYQAQHAWLVPAEPALRMITDVMGYCARRVPQWNTISISGYHIREAGSTAAQELAFTLANGIAYCDAAVAAGLSPDTFGARLSFFFNAHNDVLQEVAKFRAARRLWAHIMRDRFGATSEKAQALRFHAQTGGSTLTAQQPENNLVRVAAQALSAIYGGAQSLHTNAFDEALALPTERAATLALRPQQILMFEAGTTSFWPLRS